MIENRNCTTPSINLAIEEYALRKLDCASDDYLFLYVNTPAVIVGKNQSIYKEINFDVLRKDIVNVYRRISGGGTVYHDEGNLNFGFISKHEDFKVNNYKHFNQPIVSALIKAGISAEMDSRNNIVVDGKKVSGNAQFTNRKNILSHGTLLFNADLNVLRMALRENEFDVETKAVSSVRSSVMNLPATNLFSDIKRFKEYLIAALDAKQILKFSDGEWAEIKKLAEEKFESYEWTFGRSPFTIIKKNGINIAVEEGLIKSMDGVDEFISTKLKGVPYKASEIKKALSNLPNAFQLTSLIF